MEVAVESLAIPHEGAAAAASACGGDAAFELGLAQGACGLEATVGGGFARCQKGLGRCVGDEASVGPERGVDVLRAGLRLEGGRPCSSPARLELVDDENGQMPLRLACLARAELGPEGVPGVHVRERGTVRNEGQRDGVIVNIVHHGHRSRTGARCSSTERLRTRTGRSCEEAVMVRFSCRVVFGLPLLARGCLGARSDHRILCFRTRPASASPTRT